MARTDRQQRRRLDPESRRAAILRAATESFAARPYPEVTISSIAARAGASDALLYRYFVSKEGLYAQIVQQTIDGLLDRQARALEELPPGVSTRDRLRETTLVYLDHIATHPTAWALPLTAPGAEPTAVAEIRASTRRDYVARLRGLLGESERPRHEYALWGYFGFLDQACLRWVERGCPVDDRAALIDAALGSLEGALGDWAG